MKHNIDALSFMIKSFKDLVGRFGENSNTVEYFRSNIKGLVEIGQLSAADSAIIFELLGMKRTNSIKWAYAKDRLEQYIYAMNILSPHIYGIGAEEKLKNLINTMTYNGKHLNSTVVELLNETFGINSSTSDNDAYYGGCDRPRGRIC